MDKSEFTTAAPGELLTVPGGHAFLPAPPPTDLELPLEVVTALTEASRAVGLFLGQSKRVPNSSLIINPLLTVEAVESNRIEGTHTLVSEVLRQHVSGPPSDKDKAGRNLEVLLYRQALWQGADWIRDGHPINDSLLKGLHQSLLAIGRGQDTTPGKFRDDLVLIGSQGDTAATARFVPPPPEHLPSLIEDLVEYMGGGSPYPPLVTAAISHYQFETIHPFNDGNGRLGRLLVPLFLMDRQVIDEPILYLSVFFETHRDEYYSHLKHISTHGTWTEWLLFFLEAVRSRAADSSAKVERVLDLQERFSALVRNSSGSQAALLAIDRVMSDVFITVPGIQKYAGCAYGTAKTAVETLESLGIVARVPDQYPATWTSPDLLDEVYGL